MFVSPPDLQYSRQLLILRRQVNLRTDPYYEQNKTSHCERVLIVTEPLRFLVISISDASRIPLMGTHILGKTNGVFCKISHLKAHQIKENSIGGGVVQTGCITMPPVPPIGHSALMDSGDTGDEIILGKGAGVSLEWQFKVANLREGPCPLSPMIPQK